MNNNNKVLIGLGIVVLSLLGGFIGAKVSAPLTGGDIAGGVMPTNLWTGNGATNSVTPVTANVLVPGAISAGGVSANNQIPVIYTAVQTWPWTPSSTNPVTIASGTNNTTSTTVSFNSPGFVVGDPCEVQYTGTTSTLFTQAFVTAVNGNAVTSTVSLLNATLASITATVTSTVTGVTSTLKATCLATGV